MSGILNERTKKKCQVFTPKDIVSEMLQLVAKQECLHNKKILEYAAGSGNILEYIVRRSIEEQQELGIELPKIKRNLENNVIGYELDSELYEKCLSRIDDIANQYGLKNVKWQLYNEDFLRAKIKDKFHFIIGNPPYINYRDIDKENRNYLKNTFNACSAGKFDYCYAFIEKTMQCLEIKGKMVHLVPNNIFKNVFAEELRKMLLRDIVLIRDYSDINIFNGILTSSCIFVSQNNCAVDSIEYMKGNNKVIVNKEFLGMKWIFDDVVDSRNFVKFGDYFKASICVATQLNEAFIVDDEIVQKYSLEEGLLKKAVSPKSLREKKQKWIIFPYKYADGILRRLKSEEFERHRNIAKYLGHFRERLDRRDSDSSAKWYEFGRSQALRNLNQSKLLISTVFTEKVRIYQLDKDTVPYSGIYIVPIANNNLEVAMKVLQSSSFKEYVHRIGISVNGKSIRITCKDINEYCFDREIVESGKY